MPQLVHIVALVFEYVFAGQSVQELCPVFPLYLPVSQLKQSDSDVAPDVALYFAIGQSVHEV